MAILQTTTVSGSLTVSESVSASALVGSGSDIIDINAGNISMGTLPDARLSSNVPLRDGTNTFTRQVTVDLRDGVSGGGRDFFRVYMSGSQYNATLMLYGTDTGSNNVTLRAWDANSARVANISGRQLVSEAGAGTSPLVVASSTLVSNLNANYLEGQSSAYYRNAGNINAGTLNDGRLSGNVGLKNVTGTWTAPQTFTQSGSAFRYMPDMGSTLLSVENGRWNPLYTAIAAGTPLYSDEYFASGSNNLVRYNNHASQSVVVTRKQDTSAPNSSGYVLEITYDGSGNVTPGVGGFVPSNLVGKLNDIYVQRFIAKIPVGYSLRDASNALGTGATHYWLTSQEGTGKWEEYIRVMHFGYSGSIATTGHVYLVGQTTASVTWSLASHNIYDVRNPGTSYISANQLLDIPLTKLSGSRMVVSGPPTSARGLFIASGASSAYQWGLYADTNTQLTLGAYDDSGSWNNSIFQVSRIAGNAISIGRPLYFQNDGTMDIGGTGARPRYLYVASGVSIGGGNPTANYPINLYHSYPSLGGVNVTNASDDPNAAAIIRIVSGESGSSSGYVGVFHDSASNASLRGRMVMVANSDSDGLALWASGQGDIRFMPAGALRWSIANAGHFLAGSDNAFDIGATGSFRPRDIHIGRHLNVSGTATVNGFITSGTIAFGADNTYDLGANVSNRVRDIWLGRNMYMGGYISSTLPSAPGTIGFIARTTSGTLDYATYIASNAEQDIVSGTWYSQRVSTRPFILRVGHHAQGLVLSTAINPGSGSALDLEDVFKVDSVGSVTVGGHLVVGGQTVINSSRTLANVTANASIITAGTLADARIGSNIPRLTAENVFTINQYSERSSPNLATWVSRVTGDSISRYAVNADGKIEWGAGGSSSRDTVLYRSASGVLKTDGIFDVNALRVGGITVISPTRVLDQVSASASIITAGTFDDARLSSNIPRKNSNNNYAVAQYTVRDAEGNFAFGTRTSTDADVRWVVKANGNLGWGDGTGGLDTNLYRSSSGILRTDNNFFASGWVSSSNVVATSTVTAPTVSATDVTASNIISTGSYGISYPETSTSVSHSIVDTGIFVNQVGYDGVYEVFVSGNPNAGGSAGYRTVTLGRIIISTNYTGTAVSNYIDFIELYRRVSGVINPSFVNVEVCFVSGSTETDVCPLLSTSHQVRIKVGPYPATHIGSNQQVRLTRVF